MRYLVLSDIHSNLAALEAVLAEAGEVDQVWCLGDIVGYGPDPNECVERIRSLPHLAVVGNHDCGTLGKLDLNDFNVYARRACLWNREQLSAENWEYLDSLDELIVQGDITLVHGSPRSPIWEYVMSPEAAEVNFAILETPYCFVGHTHVPQIYLEETAVEGETSCREFLRPEGLPVPLGKERMIINPGGVGQPRDSDPRAAYLILDMDSRTIYHHRVAYSIEVTQEKMRKAGLPRRLIDRLDYGW